MGIALRIIVIVWYRPSELDTSGWATGSTPGEIAVAVLTEESLGLGERNLAGTRRFGATKASTDGGRSDCPQLGTPGWAGMLRSGGACRSECPVPGVTVTHGSVSLLTVNLLYILVKGHHCCHLCWGD